MDHERNVDRRMINIRSIIRKDMHLAPGEIRVVRLRRNITMWERDLLKDLIDNETKCVCGSQTPVVIRHIQIQHPIGSEDDRRWIEREHVPHDRPSVTITLEGV